MGKSFGTITVLVLLALPLILFVAGQFRLFAGRKPDDLGITNGLLKAPMKDWRNVVSSQAAYHPHEPHHVIAPLEYTGDGHGAMERVAGIIAGMPGARIVTATPHYLHAEFRSMLLGFVDDVEFMLDTNDRLIHMRSGARLNRKDFGANRARLESVRSRFERRAESRNGDPIPT
ncbi:DUF1499 domain-containing protein [Oxalicibacterium faecigallinarum]|uniref:DUF1499 domain-containing protein n=1 Tax=Oxalicibacterium faecigallinarum TaxID=573741 RepID=A0A8J3ATI6_9BURK|nr:DUF1499 domain-containing protein [Oxalicibacterium faecigallinarum]GGI18730.1 hypothetical protein GCM10008066_15540 [Oxalicibacterium faecigallinarum]